MNTMIIIAISNNGTDSQVIECLLNSNRFLKGLLEVSKGFNKFLFSVKAKYDLSTKVFLNITKLFFNSNNMSGANETINPVNKLQ